MKYFKLILLSEAAVLSVLTIWFGVLYHVPDSEAIVKATSYIAVRLAIVSLVTLFLVWFISSLMASTDFSDLSKKTY